MGQLAMPVGMTSRAACRQWCPGFLEMGPLVSGRRASLALPASGSGRMTPSAFGLVLRGRLMTLQCRDRRLPRTELRAYDASKSNMVSG